MKKVSLKKAEPLIKMVALIEQVVKKRRLDAQFHFDEVEAYLSDLLLGQDNINVYERRDAGISDKEWDSAVSNFKTTFNLGNKRDEGYIFDLED